MTHLRRCVLLLLLTCAAVLCPAGRSPVQVSGTIEEHTRSDLGNAVALTDAATGQVLERLDYEDFGRPMVMDAQWKLRPVSQAQQHAHLFTGRSMDPLTGLYNYRTRWYDPQVGRFLSRDTIGDWGDPANRGNGTAYCNNNPWSHVDPYGLGEQGLFGEDRETYKADRDLARNVSWGPFWNPADPSSMWVKGQVDHAIWAFGTTNAMFCYPVTWLNDKLGLDDATLFTYSQIADQTPVPYDDMVSKCWQGMVRFGRRFETTFANTRFSATAPFSTSAQRGFASFPEVGPKVAPNSATTALTKFYPENAGFAGATERTFLYPGQMIDRYGGSGYSRFFSPQGTADWARSLPPGTAGQPLRTFEVVKPFEVQSGTVAPWFNQPGGGTQYVSPVKLETLLNRGIIREVAR